MKIRFRLHVPLSRPSPELVNLLRCGPVLPPAFSQAWDGRTSAGRPDLAFAKFEHHDFQIVDSDIGKVLCITFQIN